MRYAEGEIAAAWTDAVSMVEELVVQERITIHEAARILRATQALSNLLSRMPGAGYDPDSDDPRVASMLAARSARENTP